MSIPIGQLAKKTSTGIETIRFYERRGLMPEPPRTSSGYRCYPDDAIDRLHFIRRAKHLGFTLAEIGTLLGLQDGGDRAAVKNITRIKLQEIDTRMDDLRRMRDTLADLETRCSGKGSVEGCPIIHALTDGEIDNE